LAEEIGLREEYFSAIVESYDVAALIKAAKQIFKRSREAEESTHIKKLLNRFFEFNEPRKHVAHGLWVPFMDGGTVHYTSRNTLNPERYVEQAARLEKGADELCQLRWDLERQFTAITLFRKPSPPR
jgi:hypothetical protein